VAEAAASKAHALCDGRKDLVLPKVLDEQGDFPNQTGVEGTDWQEVWTSTDPSAILFMSISLVRMSCYFLIKETHFSEIC